MSVGDVVTWVLMDTSVLLEKAESLLCLFVGEGMALNPGMNTNYKDIT